jgi:hypothetical protein
MSFPFLDTQGNKLVDLSFSPPLTLLWGGVSHWKIFFKKLKLELQGLFLFWNYKGSSLWIYRFRRLSPFYGEGISTEKYFLKNLKLRQQGLFLFWAHANLRMDPTLILSTLTVSPPLTFLWGGSLHWKLFFKKTQA